MQSWLHHLRRLLLRAAGMPPLPANSRRHQLRPKVEALDERLVPCSPLPSLYIKLPAGIGKDGTGAPKDAKITITFDMAQAAALQSQGFEDYLKGLKDVSGAGGQLVLNPGSGVQADPNETTVHVRVTRRGHDIELTLDHKVELGQAPQYALLRGVKACLEPPKPPKACHGPAQHRALATSFGFGGQGFGIGGGPTCSRGMGGIGGIGGLGGFGGGFGGFGGGVGNFGS
jgi:hypothetical protein